MTWVDAGRRAAALLAVGAAAARYGAAQGMRARAHAEFLANGAREDSAYWEGQATELRREADRNGRLAEELYVDGAHLARAAEVVTTAADCPDEAKSSKGCRVPRTDINRLARRHQDWTAHRERHGIVTAITPYPTEGPDHAAK